MSYCVLIESNLTSDTCPLSKGACYWQHRQTKMCCYAPDRELTVDEFKDLVGAPQTELDLDLFRAQLRAAL